jgi:hypothetical protein
MPNDIPIYELFRDYVKHQDSLINNRLSWLLTIHGFLYATYGFTIQKKLEVAQHIADVTQENRGNISIAMLASVTSGLPLSKLSYF